MSQRTSRRRFLRNLSGLLGAGFPYQIVSGGKRKSHSLVHFTDITETAGIKFRHNSAPEKRYIVESMSGGVALFDYDNDGYLDIYFTDALTVSTAGNPESSPSALYHNNGDGTFTDVTEGSGLAYPGWAMGVTAADFDGDGYQDLYVTCLGSNRLYHNNGDGTFTDVTAKAGVNDPRWSTGAAFGDYDRDGALDLFVANYVDFKLSDLPRFGEGKFCQYHGIPVQCGPQGLPGAGDSLFHNNGDGTFTNVSVKAGVSDPSGRYGLGVAWTDIDQDGWPDLYVANDAGPNFLYRNNRDGTFSEIGLVAGVALGGDGQEQGSMGIGIGDYLHTGLPALFVTNFVDQYDTLYRHDSPLFFTDVSLQAGITRYMGPFVSWGTAFFDYDNDGWPDLLVVNGHVYPQVDQTNLDTKYAQRMLLFHNERDGTFSEMAAECGDALTVPRVSRGAAFGDIDNDGDIDVVVENLDGSPTLLRNDGDNLNNWVTLKLRGRGMNRDAIGARVKAVAGNLVQWDEVRSGGSYLSASDLRLHYGLGECRSVDLLEVHWPSGRIEMVRNPPVNHFLTIEEGQGLIEQIAPRG
ncbi:MAG TPA: CRTAC1 family protein [Terriglobia bacterium]|nr:CRTAC1 family protein [Terriglobia bacterium]